MTTDRCCTWQDCLESATKPQLAVDGEVWADLCDAHDAQLDVGIKALDPAKTLACWIKAQGGSLAAGKRLLAGIEL